MPSSKFPIFLFPKIKKTRKLKRKKTRDTELCSPSTPPGSVAATQPCSPSTPLGTPPPSPESPPSKDWLSGYGEGYLEGYTDAYRGLPKVVPDASWGRTVAKPAASVTRGGLAVAPALWWCSGALVQANVIMFFHFLIMAPDPSPRT